MKNLLIIGPPGAGKGTQAVNISARYNIPHISTGDMFRSAMKRGTKMGLLAKEYVDNGALVPDDVTNGIVKDRLMEQDILGHGFLLDGYPRNQEQAIALGHILDELKYPLSAVVYITVSEEELIQRILARRVCKKCGSTFSVEFNPPLKDGACDNCGGILVPRKDDNRETIHHRLEVYEQQTAPLLDYFAKLNLLITVNGEQSVQDVFNDIKKSLE